MENLTRHDMAVTLRPRCELVCHKTLLEYCEHVQFSNFPSSTMANICSIYTAGCCRPRDESQHPHRPHFVLWERVQLHHSVNAEVDSKYMMCFCIQLALFCLSVGELDTINNEQLSFETFNKMSVCLFCDRKRTRRRSRKSQDMEHCSRASAPPPAKTKKQSHVQRKCRRLPGKKTCQQSV